MEKNTIPVPIGISVADLKTYGCPHCGSMKEPLKRNVEKGTTAYQCSSEECRKEFVTIEEVDGVSSLIPYQSREPVRRGEHPFKHRPQKVA